MYVFRRVIPPNNNLGGSKMAVKIKCSKCEKTFDVSADKLIINHYFSGRITVKVLCEFCGNEIAVSKTPETYEMLKLRLEKHDYNNDFQYNVITEAFLDEMQQ